MDIKTIGKLLALSAGGLASAAGAASADEGVKGLPAEAYDCKRITAENLLEPPPPLFDVKDEQSYSMTEKAFVEESKLAVDPCPAGKVAYPELDSFPAAPPHPEEAGAVRKATAYRDNQDPTMTKYRYVSKEIPFASQGASIEMNIADPQIEPAGLSHSISEILLHGEPGDYYSVELGWRKTRWQPGPRLFTFVNKDGFSSYGQPGGDCYNCHFVPLPGGDFVPGQALEVSDVSFQGMRMGINLWGGHWWIWVGDQWIGYMDRSFWPETTTYSHGFLAYGEVYDDGTGKTDMGNGHWGHDPTQASIMNDPESSLYKDGEWQITDEPRVFNPYSTVWNSNVSMYDYWSPWPDNNQRMWKYGGPGRP